MGVIHVTQLHSDPAHECLKLGDFREGLGHNARACRTFAPHEVFVHLLPSSAQPETIFMGGRQ
jgi:hypothetical protein